MPTTNDILRKFVETLTDEEKQKLKSYISDKEEWY